MLVNIYYVFYSKFSHKSVSAAIAAVMNVKFV
jgi:hypothetical protein